MKGTLLMSFGAIVMLSGFVIFNKTYQPEPFEQTFTKESMMVNSEKKGDDFEKMIVQKFDKNLFTIKEWVGDKFVDGIYAETTLHPDLLMEINLGKTRSQFSVECKWRKEAFKGHVDFSYKEQFARYKQYGKEKDIPVFIALGIGGIPSAPDKLYIIPLQEIDTWDLKISNLKDYKMNPDKDFYYDMETKMLK